MKQQKNKKPRFSEETIQS